MQEPFRYPRQFPASYCGILAMLCLLTTEGIAEYHERVRVAEPTRIDWNFAATRQFIEDPQPEWSGEVYDSTEQSYEFYGPDENEIVDKPHSLALYISPHDRPRGWQRWSPVCRQYSTIFAAPRNAGKNKTVAWRIRVTLDVLDDVRRKWAIAPARTYLCGFRDGAHVACEIAYSLPECFGGIIAIGGGEILPRELWLRRQIADRLSVGFVRSSHEETKRMLFFSVFSQSVSSSGTHTQIFPYRGKPQQLPTSYGLATALRWADMRASQRQQLAAEFPSTTIGVDGPATDQMRAERALVDAKRKLQKDESTYAGLLDLEAVCHKWPHVDLVQEAHRILAEYEEGNGAWKHQRLSERKRAFQVHESGFSTVRAAIHGHHRWQLKQQYGMYPEEHADQTWFKPRKQAHQIGTQDAIYERTTQAALRQLGKRVGFDGRNHVCSIDLSGTLITASQFEKLKERLNGMGDLRSLNLSSTTMRGSVLGRVASLSELEAVNLNHTSTDNRDLGKLASLDQLKFLALVGTEVSRLPEFSSHGELRILLLGATKVGNAALSRLTEANQLTHLSLYATDVGDGGAASLVKSPSLKYLNLSATRITDKACAVLGKSPTLEEILMDSTDITEKGLRDLQAMNRLKRLSLAGTKLTDDALMLFCTMGALQTLDVRNTKITQKAAQRLAATRPELQLRTDWTSSDVEKERRRLHLESYLNRFEDQYRLKLLEYQKRYFGFSARAETTGILTCASDNPSFRPVNLRAPSKKLEKSQHKIATCSRASNLFTLGLCDERKRAAA